MPSSKLVYSSTILIAAGGGLWYVFRRRAPIWTTKDLPPNVPKNTHVVSRLTEEERTAVKTAFLAGDDFRWLVSGKCHATDLDDKKHMEATFYVLECVLFFAENYGHTIVARDEDGTFLGAVALIPPYKSQLLLTLHLYRSILACGIPVPMTMGKEVSARFNSFFQTSKEHHALMKDTPHWYVQVLGVSPDAQGKGVGRKLMQAAAAISGGMPLYLECCDVNVPFYVKQGYTVKKRFLLTPKGIEDTSTFPINGMTCGF